MGLRGSDGLRRPNGSGADTHRGSSARFKQNIRPIDKASEAIHALKPVILHYKQELDPEGRSAIWPRG